MEELLWRHFVIVHEVSLALVLSVGCFQICEQLVEVELAKNLMKSFEILCSSSSDLACRNLWLESQKVSLFLVYRVSFTLIYLLF